MLYGLLRAKKDGDVIPSGPGIVPFMAMLRAKRLEQRMVASPDDPAVLQYTGGRLVEGFGMSEASPLTHANPIYGMRKAGSIGIPISSTDARTVDAETGTRDLPPGEVGEMVARGPQVMKGHWNNPAETVQTVRDGWLHTGDIARYATSALSGWRPTRCPGGSRSPARPPRR